MSRVLKEILLKLKIMNEAEYFKKIQKMNIGKNCHFFNVTIDRGHNYLIEVGDNCTLTNCTLLAHDASTKLYLNKSKVGRIKIGNRVFIGWDAIILPNVVIEDDCIVGAKSVVTKNVPKNSIVAGNPAKIIGRTDEYIEKHRNLMKEKPVFNTYWNTKTQKEKDIEKQLLKDTFGYDV